MYAGMAKGMVLQNRRFCIRDRRRILLNILKRGLKRRYGLRDVNLTFFWMLNFIITILSQNFDGAVLAAAFQI